MWHYEFTIEGSTQRFSADTFEECLTALIRIRATSPQLTAPKIFDGGTLEIGSGIKQFDSSESVG